MRILILLSTIGLVSSLAFAEAKIADAKRKPNQASTSKCVLVEKNGGNTPFSSANGATADQEYSIVERFVRGNISYEFQEGHGQSRLVSFKNGKQTAVTFSSRSIDLNLETLGFQVGCFALNGQTE